MAYEEQCDVARTVAKVDANVCAQKSPGEAITYSSEKVSADVAQLQKHLLLQLRQMHLCLHSLARQRRAMAHASSQVLHLEVIKMHMHSLPYVHTA